MGFVSLSFSPIICSDFNRFLRGVGDFSVLLDQEKCGNRVGIEAEPFGRVAGFRVEVVWLLVGVLFSCLSLGSIKGGLGWSLPIPSLVLSNSPQPAFEYFSNLW